VRIWKVILATLVIFGAGFVAGNLLGRRTEPAGAPGTRTANSQNLSPGQFRLQQLERRMDRELGLTAEQHERIHKIISASLERTRELWKPVTQEVGRETQKVCDEIRNELTPEQQAKYDTFAKERPDHGERGGDRGGGRRRPPGAFPGGGSSNSFNLRTN